MATLSAGLAWLTCAGFLFLPPWNAVELRVFDLMSVATAPRKSALPITIVAIDEASFSHLGQRWPWPRDLHARVVDRLAESGAAVIAFDVLFAEAATREEDEAFARAIARAGNVVLTADRGYHETAVARQWLRTDPLPLFTTAGATAGLATMSLDGDAVARRMSDAEDSFWRMAIAALARARPGTVQEPHVPRGAMIRHLGPTHTFPYVSYHRVLDGDPAIPKDFFADHIVLIGRDVRASPEIGGAQADTFATPFLMTSGLLTPGVEIQATQIENALMGQTIERAPPHWSLLAISLALLASFPALLYWHPLRSALIAAAIAAACALASLWLFAAANLWLAVAAQLLAVGLAFVSTGIGWYFIERRRAGDIRSAFAKYVSSEVVEEMIAHPERLRLGGQRREVTVLFCDLAGFTTMAERLSPDAVANVINVYLNAMTRLVMATGGTVDKFIGDAVMAFWGAPLDDPQHALHAVRAAVAMQQAMGELQPRFRELGAGSLGLRVGINSGPATVGNMGSDLRFDYTALGDTVNLASRLEGADKAYGTGILLSASTAMGVRGEMPLRIVDRVRVKGRQMPVDIHTPCGDAELARATQTAWEAYLARDWPAALAGWSAVATLAPGDGVAAVFLERIKGFLETPPPEDWDGSVAIEKL